ncbi:EAL domain-containing protein [Herminiimonas arsenitoxidans]|uniref:EAL domain-containing protein n=1 Tax=Herminiimonas arsenitoxidans TaxID=1809410 RepID=UPI0009706463|nr:EAL domain-containing protein [Herminiimonas arsenitoxidans]
MNRAKVIVIATLLAVIGVLLPISATLYLSWVRASDLEQERLLSFAQRGLERARISFSDASQALHAADYLTAAPCSEEHIRQMRIIAVNTRSIEDLGYFENGFLKCTSGGIVKNIVPQTAADFTTQDGIEVSLNVIPAINGGKGMVGLSYKAYKVLIDPVRFADIILDPEIQLAITTADGKILGTLHDPDPAQVHALLQTKKQNNDYFSTVLPDADLMAVVIEPDGNIAESLQNEIKVLLPLGVLMAAFIVGLVVWFSRRRLSPLGELKIAVEKREFIVHYQPIMELKTGLCIGAEALVRWQRPDGQMTRPDLFIPLAEESGVILPITDQVIDDVIHDMQAVLVADRDLHIAINISAQDIRTGRVLDVMQHALSKTDIQTQQIWLEATERGFMDIDAARATIDQARKMGHAVAIDDFGTGYSSLSYLQGFPLDALKIDKSFVDTIDTNSATSSVTSHIIDMAKTLKLQIVAEGIETQAQADYLLAREVDFGQGWLFAKALPAEAFIAFYKENILQRKPLS